MVSSSSAADAVSPNAELTDLEDVVPKIAMSKHALAEIFYERMKQFPQCPTSMRVEIIHVETSKGHGWTAITSPEDTLAHIHCARLVGALTIELRQQYDLIEN
jgi:hypothetical protein